MDTEPRALIFDIKRDCSEDGPGIRTTVFFKGCPLSCTWCQNPEGKAEQPQMAFLRQRCEPRKCGGACVKVCPEHCFSLIDELKVDFDKCTRCDRCIEVCPTAALEPVGYWIGLEELLYRISIDKPFYQASGGGVTVSGGEPTQQMEFLHHFLRALKQEGIHTAIETSGFFNYRRFQQQLLPYLDLIYFDLKVMDDAMARRYTGQGSQLIQENFAKLVAQNTVPVLPRVPLVPDITATAENLSAIARFLRKHHIENVSLLPYNPLWQDKLEKLDLKPRYTRSKFMSQKEKEESVKFMQQATDA